MGKKSIKVLEEAKALLARSMQINATAIQNLNRTSTPEPPTEQAKKKKWLLLGLAVIAVLATGVFLGYQYFKSHSNNRSAEDATEDATAFKDSSAAYAQGELAVLERWDLPKELKEISGNVFIDAERMACVQDNEGSIFIYNLTSKKIERTIPFGPTGDYEGLAKVGHKYYVLRGDGMLIEVNTSSPDKPEVKEFDLPLGLDNDTETLFYDEPNNRLLVAVKEKDPSGKNVKGIYAVDLTTMKMNNDAVVSVPGDLADNNNDLKKGKKKDNTLKPSDMIAHPETGELYILNGPSSQFIIADRKGSILSIIELDKKVFPQPEGLCFSPSGELYVSSEAAKNGTGVIAKVSIKR
jgi:uncharacterized protein YjiK